MNSPVGSSGYYVLHLHLIQRANLVGNLLDGSSVLV
jgi:hypothetical protein